MEIINYQYYSCFILIIVTLFSSVVTITHSVIIFPYSVIDYIPVHRPYETCPVSIIFNFIIILFIKIKFIKIKIYIYTSLVISIIFNIFG